VTPDEFSTIIDRYQDAKERVEKAQKVVARFAHDVIHFSALPLAVLPYQVGTLREALVALGGAVDALEATIRNVQPDIDAAKEAT